MLSFVGTFRARAAEHPGRLACAFLASGEAIDRQATYSELDRRAARLAGALSDRLSAGGRALLLYPPGLAFAEAFLACLYAGIVAVPAYPPRRLGGGGSPRGPRRRRPAGGDPHHRGPGSAPRALAAR